MCLILLEPSRSSRRIQKTDSAEPTSAEATVSKRTLQNRKAQREFRERKASYVKSLEERLRQYEANKVLGSLELQQVARRLQDENLRLREQVKFLTQRVRELEAATPQVQQVSGMHVAVPMMHSGRPNAPGTLSRGRELPRHAQTQQPPFFSHPPNFTNEQSYDVMSDFNPAGVQANAHNFSYFPQASF
jgi:hypothetical protein